MTDFLAVNGHRATRLRLVVPESGAWVVDADLAEAPGLSGAVTVTLGALELVGTVQRSGAFALETRARVVAGAGGWALEAPAAHHHNDAGVKVSSVLTQLAAAVGETMGDFPDRRLAADFVRPRARAARVLEGLFPGAWWVDYDGVTRAGDRGAIAIATEIDLISYDPRERIAVLAAEDLRTVLVGATLEDVRLARPLRIRALDVVVRDQDLRVHAWGEELAA